MNNNILTPADKLKNGVMLTADELSQLRADIGSMDDAQRTQLNTAVDTYARKNKDALAQDIHTENALLALKTSLMRNAETDKGLGETLGGTVGAEVGKTVETTINNTKSLAYDQWTKLMDPNDTWQNKVLRGLGIAAVAYGLYRAAKWVLKRESSWGTKLLKFLGVTAFAGWIVNRVSEKQKATEPTKKPTPAPKKDTPRSAPKKQPVAAPAPVKKVKKPVAKPVADTVPKKPLQKDELTGIENEEELPEIEEEEPTKPAPTEAVWLDHDALEDEDLLTTTIPIAIDGIAVKFARATIDGETETVLEVDGAQYAIRHATINALNPGEMLKSARMKDGELHLFGSAALGIMKGDAYLPLDELKRVVHALKTNPDSEVRVSVEHYRKDAQTANRAAEQVDIVFKRL